MARLRAIYVFAKDPWGEVPVKTRLAPHLGAEGARGLGRALLADALAGAARAARGLEATLWVACAPDRPSPELQALARGQGARLVGQGGGGLGSRLARVLEEQPAAARLALGADVPDLPRGRLELALAAVEGGTPAALGPARDGGYHLLALGPRVGVGFLRDPTIDWGGPGALAGTIAALARQAARPALLADWPDVDEPADLAALRARLAEAPDSAPATRAFLADLSG